MKASPSLLLALWAISALEVSGDFASVESCVNHWLETKPELSARFSRGQIELLCERSAEWKKEAENPPPITNDDTITRNQRNWLSSLRACSGRDCVADAIKERCRGRRCLKQPPRLDLPQTTPKPTQPAPTEEVADERIGVAKEGSASTIDPIQIFRDTRVRNINVGQLMEPLNGDIPVSEHQRAELLGGLEAESCVQKVFLSQVCPKAVAATRSSQVFEGLRPRGGISASAIRKKFTALKRKCVQLRNKLRRDPSETFGTLGNCGNSGALALQRAATGRACARVLAASSPREAFDEDEEMRRRKTQTQRRAAMRRFKKAQKACQSLQSSLADTGSSLDEWQRQGLSHDDEGGRTRSRTRTSSSSSSSSASSSGKRPRQRLSQDDLPGLDFDAPGLDFDDIDNVDFRAERKEYRMMSDEERTAFHAAMNRLKTEEIDGTSKYDLLVIYHTPAESPGAHWGPAFLPFHRELLKQLEVALRQVDSSVALPYWDSTLDQGLPEPKDSVIWSADFFGNGDGEVTIGPYANWPSTHELSFVPGMRKLFRGVGDSPYGGQFKLKDLEFAHSRAHYNDLTACVDPTFELVHGLVHMFVGGFMADIGISPNDPAFFFHHNFIDSIWEEFRLAKQTLGDRETQYPDDGGSACNAFHYKNAKMQPFTITNVQGLSNDYTRDVYFFQPSPKCSASNSDCGSAYLFCSPKDPKPEGGADPNAHRCLSKIRVGGDCSGFEALDACYGGVCDGGVCKAAPAGVGRHPTTKEEAKTTTPAPTPRRTNATTTIATTPEPTPAPAVTLPEGFCNETLPCPTDDEYFCDLEWSTCHFKMDVGEECAGLEGLHPCRSGSECLDGFCTVPFVPECTAADPTCPEGKFCDSVGGQCIQQVALGDFCNGFEGVANVCAPPNLCVDDVCQAQQSATTPGPALNPEECTTDVDCGETTFCDGGIGRCSDRIPENGPCEGLESFPRACQNGLSCQDAHCKPLPISVPDCETGADCPQGQYCDSDYKQCTAQIPLGGPCDGLEGVNEACAGDAECREGLCQPPATSPPPGCASSADCSAGKFCDVEYSECLLRIVDGEDCTGFEAIQDACAEGLACRDARCSPIAETTTAASTASCASLVDCSEDEFCDEEFRRCTPLVPIGQACGAFGDQIGVCAENGACVRGLCTVGECNENKPCPSGQFCDTNLLECSEQIPLGQSCSGLSLMPGVCADGGVCEDGLCLGPATTAEPVTTTETPTTTTEAVAECNSDAECGDGFFCDLEYSECLLRLEEGEPCTGLEAYEKACVEGLACVEGRCGAAAPPTAPPFRCSSNFECEEGSFCRLSAGDCLPFIPVGAACPSQSEPPCRDGAECVRGTCRLPAPTTTPPRPTTPSTTTKSRCRPQACGQANFCDVVSGDCVPAFKVSEVCAGFEESGAALICDGDSVCVGGVCTARTTPPPPTTTPPTTARPTTATTPGTDVAAPFPVVYLTISVIRGNVNFYKQPVPGAQVSTTGRNVPSGYTQTLSGETSLSSTYPYYVGAAVVRVMDPSRAGYFPLAQAQVDVVDEMGRPCKPMCYQASRKAYTSCSNIIRLSTNSYYSDPVQFRRTKQEALEAGWTRQGYYRQRLPDYLLFQC